MPIARIAVIVKAAQARKGDGGEEEREAESVAVLVLLVFMLSYSIVQALCAPLC